ncbi:MAG: hypothetical protein RQ723_12055 [Desulfuromonadales bacterium]|nr:hypothetical protein [Desulfuromonadales bacterium]
MASITLDIERDLRFTWRVVSRVDPVCRQLTGHGLIRSLIASADGDPNLDLLETALWAALDAADKSAGLSRKQVSDLLDEHDVPLQMVMESLMTALEESGVLGDGEAGDPGN